VYTNRSLSNHLTLSILYIYMYTIGGSKVARRGGAPKGFKFSSHPGNGSARRTAGRAGRSFKVSGRSPGGRTKSTTSGFKS
jgi:hypothetical protein